MTHAALPVRLAVAAKVPAVPTNRSAAMSPSVGVMIRVVNPLVPPANTPVVVPAPTIVSFA